MKPPTLSGHPADAPRGAGLSTALSRPCLTPTGEACRPWPRAGPGGPDLPRGPALAALVRHLGARGAPGAAGPAGSLERSHRPGPPSPGRRVKCSAEQGSWAPRGGLKAHSQRDSSLAQGMSLARRARGTKGLWPGLCRGPHSPTSAPGPPSPCAPQPSEEGQKLPPGPRPPGSATVPHAWWPAPASLWS